MLKLPIHKLDPLWLSIEKGVKECLHEAYQEPIGVYDITLLTLLRDKYLGNIVWSYVPKPYIISPLGVCTVSGITDTESMLQPKECYFAFLVDMFSLRLIGKGVQLTSGGNNIRPSLSEESYEFYKGGIRNLRTYYPNEEGYTQYKGFTLGEFVSDLLHKDRMIRGLSPYESWVLKFLSARETFLDSHRDCIGLFNSYSNMEYREGVWEQQFKLIEDIQHLLKEYPSHST